MGLTLHGVWDLWGIAFDPIPFKCWDGEKVVRCWASLDALSLLSGVEDLEDFADPELADLFACWVDEFVRIASIKYTADEIRADGSVHVGVTDVRSHRDIAPALGPVVQTDIVIAASSLRGPSAR